MMIRNTVVGSWPPDPAYHERLQRFFRGELTKSESEALLHNAAAEAIRQQRDCGLMEYTGGETSADTFILHFPKYLSGIERQDAEAWDGRGTYRIVGELVAPNGLGIAEAFRRERGIDLGVRKVTIPGPSEITMMIEPEADRRKIWPQVVDLIRDEIHASIDAGAADVQLDMPHAAMALADKHENWSVEQVVEIIQQVFSGVSGIRRSVHFCYGDFEAQTWTQNRAFQPLLPVIQRLDGTVDRMVLEFSLPEQWAERFLLAEIPESMEVAVGIIDVKSTQIESVAEIQEKIREILRYLPTERLLICPSCGFGRRDLRTATGKTKAMVNASQTVTE